MDGTKPIWQSKILWLAAVETVGGIIELIFDGLDSGIGWVAIGVGILTLIARKWFTTKSI